MSARDEAVQLMDDFDSAWCRDGALYGKKYLGELLDAIPADLLARLAVERGGLRETEAWGYNERPDYWDPADSTFIEPPSHLYRIAEGT